MSQLLDFTIEMNCDEAVGRPVEQALFSKADETLRSLAADHNDLRGAAITVRVPAHGATPSLYEATIAVYARPDQIAATEKRDDPVAALNGALEAIARQVRAKRAKLGQLK